MVAQSRQEPPGRVWTASLQSCMRRSRSASSFCRISTDWLPMSPITCTIHGMTRTPLHTAPFYFITVPGHRLSSPSSLSRLQAPRDGRVWCTCGASKHEQLSRLTPQHQSLPKSVLLRHSKRPVLLRLHNSSSPQSCSRDCTNGPVHIVVCTFVVVWMFQQNPAGSCPDLVTG